MNENCLYRPLIVNFRIGISFVKCSENQSKLSNVIKTKQMTAHIFKFGNSFYIYFCHSINKSLVIIEEAFFLHEEKEEVEDE